MKEVIQQLQLMGEVNIKNTGDLNSSLFEKTKKTCMAKIVCQNNIGTILVNVER